MTDQFDAWVDKLSAHVKNYALAREYRPTAFAYWLGGRTEKTPMHGDGLDHTRNLRALALVTEPDMLALVTEAWTLRHDISPNDAYYRQLIFGEMRPSELPEEVRGELVSIYAEERSSGEHTVRGWYIHKDPLTKKRVGLEEWPAPPKDAAIRFWPVFVVDEELRSIDRGDSSIPKHLLDAVRAAGQQLSEEDRRLVVKRLWAELLLEGAGYTTAEFEQKSDEFHRRARQWVFESGKPGQHNYG